jgi:hypothetical protein
MGPFCLACVRGSNRTARSAEVRSEHGVAVRQPCRVIEKGAPAGPLFLLPGVSRPRRRTLFDKLRQQFGPSGDKPAEPVWTQTAPRRGDERSEESTREPEGPKQP